MGKEEQKVYFVTRSCLMGLVGATILFMAVLILRIINFIQIVLISTLAFLSSLSISRLFDSRVEKLVKKIIKFLDKNQKIKNLIVNHF